MSARDEGRTDPDSVRVREAIKGSGDLLGAVGGGAVGLIGGPPGALGGAAAGVLLTRALTRVGLEVYDRLLVRRQQERVGAALAVMSDDASQLAEAGTPWRSDGFFDQPSSGRSEAEELVEGVLLHAADAYQEAKLRHLAAIVPALAVRPDVSAADGMWITELASRLTWRQLIVLAIFAALPDEEPTLDDFDRDPGRHEPLPGMFAEEIEELAAIGLLGTVNADGVMIDRTVGGVEGGVWQIDMAAWRLTVPGRLVAELARLDDVPADELEPVLRQLRAA
jgi:hypothetical protein